MSTVEATGPTDADKIVARIERIPMTPFHKRLVGMLGISMLFDAFNVYIIGAVGALITSFAVSDQIFAFILSANYAGQFVGTLVLGYLSEKFGRKPGFILSLGSFGLLGIVAAFAENADQLIWARVFQGIGIGALPPLAGAMLSEILPRKDRGKWGALFQSLYPVGIIISPALGYVALHYLGMDKDTTWRFLFLFGALPLPLAIWYQFVVPESPRWLANHGHVARADKIVKEFEASAIKAGIALPPPESHFTADTRKTDLMEIFRSEYRARAILVWVQSFTAFFVVNAFTSYLPRLYTGVGGLDIESALLMTGIFGGVELGVRIIMAYTWDQTGRLPWFIGGYIAAVIGCFAAWAAFDIFHATGWVILATFGVMGTVGCNISVGGVYVYHPELFPTRMRSWATSTGRAVRSAASIIGPLIIGQILSAKLGPGPVFLMFGVVALVGLVVMVRLGVETKQASLEKIAK